MAKATPADSSDPSVPACTGPSDRISDLRSSRLHFNLCSSSPVYQQRRPGNRWQTEASRLVPEPGGPAKESGAALVIINREPTGLDDLTDLVINAEIGPTLDAAVNGPG